MNLPHVTIGSLGGTITMTPSSPGEGVLPRLRAEDLLAAVPDLNQVADISAETLMAVPSTSLSFANVLAALDWASAAVDGGADGVVLVQGTDTLEETAYLLDLFWDKPQPLVLTGAMRTPVTPGADGPGNLLAAVLTAGSPDSRHVGVVVVMNDVVHAASRVRKSHATGTDAFTSPNFGPLGYVHEGRLVYDSGFRRISPLTRPQSAPTSRVALLETCLDDDGRLIQLALKDGYDGVIIAALGAGHVSSAVADVMEAAVEHVPVVFASRTGAGATLTQTYGFPGSELDLIRRGAVSAGILDARKARLLLWALLATGEAAGGVTAEFERRGTPSGSGGGFPGWDVKD